jgi:hypothetical protein
MSTAVGADPPGPAHPHERRSIVMAHEVKGVVARSKGAPVTVAAEVCRVR